MMQASTNRMRDRVHHESRDARRTIKKVVEDNPVGSAAIVFGLGIGAGLAIAGLINESTRPKHHSLAHRLGEQMLSSVQSVLPESLYNH